MTKAPFFLVTGFLGSGKTTFLKQFLTEFAGLYRIAVIQNEFAPGKIDGKFLAGCGKPYTLIEINRGSVFCVCLLSDFKSVLIDIISAKNPDIIILEATGLADPISIAQFLESSELADKIYLACIWCIADVCNILNMQSQFTRVNHQLRVADYIILNKCDRFHGSIKQVEQNLKKINPFSEIIQTTFCDMDIQLPDKKQQDLPVAIRQKNKHVHLESYGKPKDFGFCVVKTPHTVKKNNLWEFLKAHEKQIYRIKGIAQLDNQQMVAVQSSFGESTIEPISGVKGPTELIALGINLDANKFRDDFRQMMRN